MSSMSKSLTSETNTLKVSKEALTLCEKAIWHAFDIIRSGGNIQNYSIVGLMLFLHKGSEAKINCTDNTLLKDELLDILLKKHSNENYEQAVNIIFDSCHNLSDTILHKLLKALNPLVDLKGQLSFSLIFEKYLEFLVESEGRRGGYFGQPKEVTDLMLSFFPKDENYSVYNPFAGLASFALSLPDSVSYYGQEIDQSVWALTQLRFAAHNCTANKCIKIEDSLSIPLLKASIESQQSDLFTNDSSEKKVIISSPPFGLRIDSTEKSSFRAVEAHLLNELTQQLTDGDKAIMLAPMGLLFRGGNEAQLREQLIESDLLETVIQLPGGLFNYTAIPVIILVLNTAKEKRGVVTMIDAKEAVINLDRRRKKLDLALVIRNIEETGDWVRSIDNSQILENNYNLNPGHYFVDETDFDLDSNEELIPLSKLISPYRGERVQDTTEGPMVTFRALSKVPFEWNLRSANFESRPVKPSSRKLVQSCLILSSMMPDKRLKVANFIYDGNHAFIHPNFRAYNVDENEVLIDYLIHELSEEYVQKQLAPYMGAAMHMPFNRLMETKVKLVSIEEQKAKIQGIKEAYVRSIEDQHASKAKILGVESKAVETFKSLKHSMGTPLTNLDCMIDNIEAAIKRLSNAGEQISLQSQLSPTREVTLGDSLKQLRDNVDFINRLLEQNAQNLDLSKFPLSDLNILHFCKTYVNSIKVEAGDEYNLILDQSQDFDSTVNYIIQANQESLTILFDNVLSNARRHAFVPNPENQNNFRIALSLSEHKETKYVRIEMSNNGNPFPKDVSYEDFTRKNFKVGETGNTGIGGSDIDKIVKNMDGQGDLLVDNSSYVTTFIFEFPISSEEE